MKAAFIGDIHARGADLDRTAGALAQAMGFSRDCFFRFIAGDIFDRFNVADREASVGTVYRRIMDAIEDGTIIITGNHDLAGVGQLDALQPLNETGLVYRDITCDRINYDIGWLLIPWQLNKEHLEDRILEKWNEIKDCKSRAIIAHCDIDGALTNADRMMVGGSFNISRQFLKSLNADIVALGHIHKRQELGLGTVWGGYLGSLVQCNYGEGFCAMPGQEREHQPQGFMVWDTETNSVEWRDVQASKYWTVPTEWYADFHSQIPEADLVKIKGKDRPLTLPEGVRYEPVIEAVVRDSRTTGIEADESPEALLQHWHSATQSKVDIAKLQEGLKQILGKIQLPGSAIGSLERIDRIQLENIATHKNTDLDLSKLDGLIGISGHNGAGKTYAVESLYAALYGEFPSRPGTLADRVTRGFTGDAVIHAEFDSNGNHYRASRNIHRTAKTSKIEAFIYNGNGGIGSAIAGPKGADVDRAASNLVGDPSVLLATVFSAQGQIGNLIDAEPRDRKEHFAKLLGTDRLLVIGEKAKDLLGNDERDSLYWERRIADLELQLAGKQQAEYNLREQQEKVAPIEAQLKVLNEEMATLRQKLADLQAIQKRRNEIQTEITRVENEISSTRDKIEAKQSQIEAAKKRLEKRAGLAAVASQRPGIEVALAKADAEYQAAKEQRSDLELQLANLRTEYQRIYGQMESLAKDQTAELEREISKVKDQIREIERKHEIEESNLKTALRTLESDLSSAERRAALLDSGKFDHQVCSTCPFTQDAFKAKGTIAGLKADIVRAEIAIDHCRAERAAALVEPKELLQELQNRLQAFDAKEWMKSDPACADLRNQLAANRKTGIETKARLESLQVPDNTQVRTLRGQLDNEIAQAERELATLVEVEKSIESMKKDVSDYHITIARSQQLKGNLENDLAGIDQVDTSDIDAQIKDKQIDIQMRQDDLNNLHQLIGQAQAELKRFEQIDKDIETAKTNQQVILDRSEQWTELQKAFSRDGIPQLIVDSAIPRLQQLLAELLGEFENRWAIRLDTQRETKAGTIQERIDIRVIDANGEDDISAYSGGEKHLLRSILRIALGMLQAERSGKSLKVFIFDEAFDALDRDNAIRLLAVFRHLLNRFNQVFIVSHSDELLSVLPTQIRFSKVNDITKVEVING